MSVTIRDILRLPSLYCAEVAAGRGGLDRSISAVSVLETVNPELIDSHVNKEESVSGGELVITSFINAPDDEELQYRNVRQLAESGEAGLIVYYVGVFMKDIPRRVLEYADEHDFVIICMPRNQGNLRYSDAIGDIMEAVVRDRDRNGLPVVELLDAIVRLPSDRRRASTMLKLISERLHTALVLLGQSGRVISEAAWPGEYAGIAEKLKKERAAIPEGKTVNTALVPSGQLRKMPVRTESGELELYFISIGSLPPEAQQEEAAEAVRIAVNLWEEQTDTAPMSELVRAILNDDPQRMRSLASLFGIAVASVSTMWVFSGEGLTEAMARSLSEGAKMFCSASFAALFEGRALLFTGTCAGIQDLRSVYEQCASILPVGTSSALFTNLENTSEVRRAYDLFRSETEDAIRLLPGKVFYTGSEIGFALRCREIIRSGEERIAAALAVLRPLSGLRDRETMLDTLSVFLLDADQSVQDTAERLFVHKNTVKYRLKVTSDCFGFRVGTMPASAELYQALGVRRLINS